MAESITEQANSHCVMCMNSFGTDEKRVPRICINPKCRQRFCTECVDRTEICNGENRRFRCMYCLLKYDDKCKPIEDRQLKTQLWEDAIKKYGINQTRYLLESQCTVYDLKFDMECRKFHLENLVSRRKRLPNWQEVVGMIIEGAKMANELENIIQRCYNQQNGDLQQYKNDYKHAISMSDDTNDFGSKYIRLCDQLLVDISNADMRNIMPTTNALMEKWIDDFNYNREFRPKFSVLIDAVQQDVKNRCSSLERMGRVKIGVIGYTNAGKSSLVNKLRNIGISNTKEAAPVRSKKCTYYQLHFDRQEPLIHPENSNEKIEVTLVDIPGLDSDARAVGNNVEAGKYLDEIRKADCDIYLLVFDQQFRLEQNEWINYIEEELERHCILVRSKVDQHYLSKFCEYTGKFYSRSKKIEQMNVHPDILKQLRFENNMEPREVYLTAADSMISNPDELDLLEDHKFDFEQLLEQLGRVALNARDARFLMMATRIVSHVINTCFRRGYVINVLGYKIAAGIAAVIPCGDRVTFYLSKDEIQKAFGIDEVLLQRLRGFKLIIGHGQLQRSVFKKYVQHPEAKASSKLPMAPLGTTVGGALMIAGTVADDIIRSAIPAAASGAARIALTTSTLVLGVALSAGVCTWSAIRSDKDIFRYVNQLCDDLILVLGAITVSVIQPTP